MKILVVEDTVSIGQLYQEYFTMRGEEVQWLNDVDLLLGTAAELQPDVILLDLMMPKKDGIEMLAQLKSDDRTKHIPVVLLTNVSTDTVAGRAQELGAARYVIKSDIELHDLLDLCYEVAGKTPA